MREFALSILLVTATLPTHAAWSANNPTVLSSPFITGSELYPVADFAPLIGRYVGRTMGRGLIDQITADIQAKYAEDGYVVPQVLMLDSDLASSTPRIHIFEARIAEVAIRGDAGPYLQTIMDHAALLDSNIIHKQRSRTYFRRIEELPGLKLRAAFEPRANQPHRYTLVMNVSYDAVRASVAVHNRGTEELGRTMVAARVTLNGVLGAEEAVSLVGAASTDADRYHYIGGRVEKRLGRVGTQLDVSSSRAKFESDYSYSTERARLELNVIGYDDGVWRIDPLAAIGGRNGAGEGAADLALSETKTRFIEAGLSARRLSPSATSYFWSTFTRGLDGLGASAWSLYGTPGELEFSKANMELLHVHSLAPLWRMRFDLDAQWSGDDLPAGERFTFGGARLGRAFEPAALIGDSGAGMSVQLERHQRWKHPWFRGGKLYLQADYGYAEHHDAASDDAASMTLGLSTMIASAFASLELSHPLMRPEAAADSNDLRAFFLMQVTF
jgi:hemolysin activation/secretion protein